MIKKYFLFMSINFWYLSEVLTQTSLHEINKENFKSYLIDSLDHICKQSGWKTMEHLQFQQFECAINTSCITKDSVNKDNYLEKMSCITHLLNCQYTIVMENFNVILGVILDKCQEEKYNNQIDQFGHCLNRILNIVKSSITTFSKILDAARYINQIDLRIINSSLINSKCIENEIQIFYNRVCMIVQLYSNINLYFSDYYEEIIEFHKEAEKIIFNLYKNRKVCGPNHVSNIPTDLVTIFNINQINKSVDNSSDYVNNIYIEVSSYLSQVIENNFLNLGFEQLIGTNLFKFIHCTSNWYPINDGIELFKDLLSHKGWELLKNITVKHKFSNWAIININQLKIPIDKNSYTFIQHCVSHFLSCRYLEILQYFNYMLESINKVCEDEDKNSCATTIFDIMVKSDEMFKNMLFALMTLRYTKVGNKKIKIPTNIELQIEFCRNFFYDMRRKYQTSSSFIGQIMYFEPKDFLDDIKIFTKDLSTKISYATSIQKRFCEINKNGGLRHFMIEFDNLMKIDINREYTYIHKTMYEFFYVFIEKVNKENFENLGFNKITKL
ncbi:uncharacterized protein LOC126894464 isoform X6 [Daktulosphaira vitifoliae]|uniref:uncharacterized protein LOC126894464 isoform X6 n=1 Tax=Daktulosphaira vitifoliae TaxID=58002 RepID=UPI0021AAAB47|nr:uncharacterized protein LOC126894464 isoform X6 [Daktulosphaira vitifoliae]